MGDRSTAGEVDELVHLCSTERDAILQGPRRRCALQEYPDTSKDVLGKVLAGLCILLTENICCNAVQQALFDLT